ncbi:hypothetical protein FRX31_017788, partial [Thalictrum thalictroides]
IQLHNVLSQGFDDNSWTLQSKTGRYAGEVRLIMHYSNANKHKSNHAPSAPPYGAAAVSQYAPPPSAAPYSYPPAAAYPSSYQYPSAYPPNPMAYPPNPVAYPPNPAAYPPNPAAYPPSPYNTPPQPAAYPPQPYPPAAYPPQPYPPAAYPPQPYPPPPQGSSYYPPSGACTWLALGSLSKLEKQTWPFAPVATAGLYVCRSVVSIAFKDEFSSVQHTSFKCLEVYRGRVLALSRAAASNCFMEVYCLYLMDCFMEVCSTKALVC